MDLTIDRNSSLCLVYKPTSREDLETQEIMSLSLTPRLTEKEIKEEKKQQQNLPSARLKIVLPQSIYPDKGPQVNISRNPLQCSVK